LVVDHAVDARTARALLSDRDPQTPRTRSPHHRQRRQLLGPAQTGQAEPREPLAVEETFHRRSFPVRGGGLASIVAIFPVVRPDGRNFSAFSSTELLTTI